MIFFDRDEDKILVDRDWDSTNLIPVGHKEFDYTILLVCGSTDHLSIENRALFFFVFDFLSHTLRLRCVEELGAAKATPNL
jgi:hypothetical protein